MWDMDKNTGLWPETRYEFPEEFPLELLPDLAKLLAWNAWQCNQAADKGFQVGAAVWLMREVIIKNGWGEPNFLAKPKAVPNKDAMKNGWFFAGNAWKRWDWYGPAWFLPEEEKREIATQELFPGWDGVRAQERLCQWMKENHRKIRD